MSRFVLKIELGNDAMQNAMDVANALRNAAIKIETNYDEMADARGPVKDVNGNTVGSWEVQ